MLRNKDNLHLISLGCSAGNNGRHSCEALNSSTAGAEWLPLFGAGAAGALQSGLELCVTEHGHRKKQGAGKAYSISPPVQGRCSAALGCPKGKSTILQWLPCGVEVSACPCWCSLLLCTEKGRRGWLQLFPENYGQGLFRSKPGHAQGASCSCSYFDSTQEIDESQIQPAWDMVSSLD